MNTKKRLKFLVMTVLFFAAPFCEAATSPFSLGGTTDASKLAAGALALGALGGGLWLYNKSKGAGAGVVDKTKPASLASPPLSTRLRPENFPMQVQQAAAQQAVQAIPAAVVQTVQQEESKIKPLERENKELRDQVRVLREEKNTLEIQNSVLQSEQKRLDTRVRDLESDKSRLESSSQQTQSVQSVQDQAIIAVARQERDRAKDQLAGKEREVLELKAKLEKVGTQAKELQQKMRSIAKPELQKDAGEIKEEEATTEDKPRPYQQRLSQKEETESHRADDGDEQEEQGASRRSGSRGRRYGRRSDYQSSGAASAGEDRRDQEVSGAFGEMQEKGEQSGDDYQQLKENNSQLYAENTQLKAENEKMNSIVKENKKLNVKVSYLNNEYNRVKKLYGTLQHEHTSLTKTIDAMRNQMAQTPLDDDELRLLKKLQQSNPYQETLPKVEKPSRSKPRARQRVRPQATQ